MTIKIKNVAVRSVTDASSHPCSLSNPALSKPPSSYAPADDEVISYPSSEKLLALGDWGSALVSEMRVEKNTREGSVDIFSRLPDLDDTDDELTVSSCSSSSSSSFVSAARLKVTFAAPLVTEVRTRPRTPPEEVTSLFYSYEETQRFRQDYRLERKKLAEAKDSATESGQEELKQLDSDMDESNARNQPDFFRISRVVVVHQDTLETFFDNDMTDNQIGNAVGESLKPASDRFFDNDSFWSGQITWY